MWIESSDPQSDCKQQIANLRAVYAATATRMCHAPDPSYEEFMRWRALGRIELPLVGKHESGRKSLVIGNYAVNVLGMDPLEGIELLVYLRDWATQDRSFSHLVVDRACGRLDSPRSQIFQ